MSAAVKVSPKYQITIPPEIRDRYGFAPGDTVVFYDSGDGALTLIKPLSFDELGGMFAHLPYEPFVRDKVDPDDERGLG